MAVSSTPPITITWIGHATVLIDIDGYRILTDPALTFRLAHLRRRVPIPAIEPVDAVLISHIHMDHLHPPSLRAISHDSQVVVPRGAASLIKRARESVVHSVTEGDHLAFRLGTDRKPEIAIDVVHARHYNGRGPHSRVHASPVGYIIRVGKQSLYFAGDTDLFVGMKNFGALDIAFLPIWGWGPTLGERHLTPETAATATDWLNPTAVVPIHWGTYSPLKIKPGTPPWISNPLAAFQTALIEERTESQLHALLPGDSLKLLNGVITPE